MKRRREFFCRVEQCVHGFIIMTCIKAKDDSRKRSGGNIRDGKHFVSACFQCLQGWEKISRSQTFFFFLLYNRNEFV